MVWFRDRLVSHATLRSRAHTILNRKLCACAMEVGRGGRVTGAESWADDENRRLEGSSLGVKLGTNCHQIETGHWNHHSKLSRSNDWPIVCYLAFLGRKLWLSLPLTFHLRCGAFVMIPRRCQLLLQGFRINQGGSCGISVLSRELLLPPLPSRYNPLPT